MFTSYNPTYSIQPSGTRARILTTSSTAQSGSQSGQSGSPSAAATTQALVTLAPETATVVARELTSLVEHRTGMLYSHATDLSGKVSQLRRSLIGLLLNSPAGSTAGQGPNTPARAHRSNGATSPAPVAESAKVPMCIALDADAVSLSMATLAETAAGLSDAERRAVADEVGRIFAGTDDVLVPVALEDGYGDLRHAALANGFLVEATDVEVLDMADPYDESGVLYEGLLAHLRTSDADINQACDREWVDVNLDPALVAAWIRHNRPHLAGELAKRLD